MRTPGKQNFIEQIGDFLFTNYLEQMPSGKKLRIEAITEEMAVEVAKVIRLRIASSHGSPPSDQVIGVVSREIIDEEICISIHKAVEYRNTFSKVVLFVPEGAHVELDSIGTEVFDSLSMIRVFKEMTSKAVFRLDEQSPDKSFAKRLRSAIPNRTSVSEQALFFSTLESLDDPSDQFGPLLWMAGLIPDLGDLPIARVELNARAVEALISAQKPLASSEERMISANVADGKLRRELIQRIGSGLKINPSWFRDLPEHLTFDKWPFLDSAVAEIEDVRIDSFLEYIDGQPRATAHSKLTFDQERSVLVCDRNKVTVKWKTIPSQITNLGYWLVELAPPRGLQSDFPILREKYIRGSLRTTQLELNLDEEELEDLAPRYLVRLTAVDKEKRPLDTLAGNVASFESDEFELGLTLLRTSAERTTQAYCRPEAVLRFTIQKGYVPTEDRPLFDRELQTFKLSLGDKDSIAIPASNIFAVAQRLSFESESMGLAFQIQSHTGLAASEASIVPFSLLIPSKLRQRRNRLMRMLVEQTPNFLSVELANWSQEATEESYAYLRAYKKALDECKNRDELEHLLLMDSVTVSTRGPAGETQGVVLLPTHPFRLAWLAKHNTELRAWADALVEVKGNREAEIDQDLLYEIRPANLPLVCLGKTLTGEILQFTHFQELTYGSGLYLNPESTDRESDVVHLLEVLNLNPMALAKKGIDAEVHKRVFTYFENHQRPSSLRVRATNPGSGSLIADSILKLFKSDDGQNELERAEVSVFSDRLPFSSPVSDLVRAQHAVAEEGNAIKSSFLSPQLAIKAGTEDDFMYDADEANISVLQSFLTANVRPVSSGRLAKPLMDGLLNAATSSLVEDTSGTSRILVNASLGVSRRKFANELATAHSSLLSGIGSLMFETSSAPVGIVADLDERSRNLFAKAHTLSDWVIVLDRHLTMSSLESLLELQSEDPFVLDYSPDFVDGISERLSVTTTRLATTERVVGQAMEALGFEKEHAAIKRILLALSSVSGKLALRLVGNTSSVPESVGLAAAILVMEGNGELKNRVLIPVDAHLEFFGLRNKRQGLPGQRCDVIAVAFRSKGWDVEFLEVKARSHEIDPELPNHILGQVNQTEQSLMTRLFGAAEARIDSDLQWARWISMLHFYADRALHHGHLDSTSIGSIHEEIDKLELTRQKPTIRKTGYIVALGANRREVPARVGDMNLFLLDSQMMEEVGFSTKFTTAKTQSTIGDLDSSELN